MAQLTTAQSEEQYNPEMDIVSAHACTPCWSAYGSEHTLLGRMQMALTAAASVPSGSSLLPGGSGPSLGNLTTLGFPSTLNAVTREENTSPLQAGGTK